MGEKNIKKEVKKKKKTGTTSVSSAAIKTAVAQPELITKKKKPF